MKKEAINGSLGPIFVSYSESDKANDQRLFNLLFTILRDKLQTELVTSQDKLGEATVFIALTSNSYYNDPKCGEEWAKFESRKGLSSATPLLPIKWLHAEPVPEILAQYQFFRFNEISSYWSDGLRAVLDDSGTDESPFFEELVHQIRRASKIPLNAIGANLSPGFPRTPKQKTLFRGLALLTSLVLLWLLYFGYYFYRYHAGSKEAPPILRKLVLGHPTEPARAHPTGSAVQMFEGGWLLNHGEQTYVLLRIPKENERIRWVRLVQGSSRQLERLKNINPNLRVAYSHFSGELGQPLPSGSRSFKAWIQFQEWTEGLFLFGVPTNPYSYAPGTSGEFTNLAGVFLEGAPSAYEGLGKMTSISAEAAKDSHERTAVSTVSQHPKASVNWYPIPKESESKLHHGIDDDQFLYCRTQRWDIRTRHEFLKGHKQIQLY